MRVFIVAALLFSCSAIAQTVESESQRGVEQTVPFGSAIWEHKVGGGAPGVIIKSPVSANWGGLENVDLPAGTALGIVLEKKYLQACQSRGEMRLGMAAMTYWSSCLIDSETDGKFDRVTYRKGGFSKKIDPPVEYVRALVPLSGAGVKTARKVLVFLGASTGQLRLSYREFADDLARPAFTEDITLPLGGNLPRTLAVKDIRLTVLGVDDAGIRFRLD